jgi:signal transduction histidine kinase
VKSSSKTSDKFISVKVLVVDDRPENLIAMQAAFKGCGYEVYQALSGKEALELVKEHEFACILLDVQMPVMDGFETALWIRREPRSRSTPIIFATAIHRTEEYEELGYDAGAVDYLFKPINTTILKAKVSIFVDLYLQSEEIKKKNALLEEAILKTRENEELKAALASRDEFLLMASHELKTPLTPLSLQLDTFIQLYKDGTASSIPPEKLLRMLYTSQGQVDRLSRLINELVDASRLSTQKIELNLTQTNLSVLAKKVINDFSEEIKRSGSTLSLTIESDVSGKWDSFRVEQVLINLLINCLKYGGGKAINITVGVHGDVAKFQIKDHGIGIAKIDHARIFQRFERAVSAKNYSGLGLGLYISNQIVSLHGGRIELESQLNEGSTFTVLLPNLCLSGT